MFLRPSRTQSCRRSEVDPVAASKAGKVTAAKMLARSACRHEHGWPCSGGRCFLVTRRDAPHHLQAGLAAIVGYEVSPGTLGRLGVYARGRFDWPNNRRNIDRLCTLPSIATHSSTVHDAAYTHAANYILCATNASNSRFSPRLTQMVSSSNRHCVLANLPAL